MKGESWLLYQIVILGETVSKDFSSISFVSVSLLKALCVLVEILAVPWEFQAVLSILFKESTKFKS